jgi:imidazolonepropionase-like amidohydrolase
MSMLITFASNLSTAEDLAIVGARLYQTPNSPAIPNSVVLIRDGRILKVGPRNAVAVPSGFKVLDRSGATMTAGFWNSHVHLTTAKLFTARELSDAALTQELEDMFTRWGFTTVFDLASTTSSAQAIRQRVETGNVAGPHILTVGEPFYPQDGTPIYAIPIYQAYKLESAEISSTADAVARAARQIEAGNDGIKLFTGSIVGGKIGVLPMPAEQVRAIAAEAHRLGRPVFAHPTDQAGLDVAIDNGVDILAHAAALAGKWSPQFVARMKARNVALIPTLALFQIHADASTPMEIALQQVQAQSRAGGDVLFGTDVGFIDAYDTSMEISLMSKVLTWRSILASLTTTPARRFGRAKDSGRISVGYVADLVILKGDPAVNVNAFSQVREVMRGGKIIYRRAD